MSVPRRWLQRELQIRLLLPVLGLVVISAILGGLGAHRLVDRVFDHWLLDAAQSLARQVRFENGIAKVELSEQSASLLTFDAVDRTHYEVEQAGRRVTGDAVLGGSGAGERRFEGGARAFDGEIAGEPVRIAEVPMAGAGGGAVTVRVSETLSKRHVAQRDLLLMFAPVAVLIVAVAIVLGVVVRRTIAPLEDIANRWSARSHSSLEEIPTHDVPRELLPFSVALNHLLARVRQMLERERGFAANAAHQLRTPLAGLQLGLERAARAPDLASARAVLAELGESTQRTARLVRQLLALSRLDPELKADGGWGDIDLLELAHGVGESYLDSARTKGIELRLQDDTAGHGPVIVRGQPDLLSEALGNLLDNALQYTPAGGSVTLTVAAMPASICVSDTGRGIADDERERVFERFQRGRAAQGAGSGLGLAIVREIAALHGARALLHPGAGGGTCVELRFGTDTAAARDQGLPAAR